MSDSEAVKYFRKVYKTPKKGVRSVMEPKTPEDKEKLLRFRSVKVIEVIETVVCEGDGSSENVYRAVSYYHDFKGNLLAKNDPYPDGKVK